MPIFKKYRRFPHLWSRCKASQAHEESCVSNGLRMYAAEMVMDQVKTWLAQAGKLIDW
jgi:hypothetical protein